MSEAAQAVERAVNEMKAKRTRKAATSTTRKPKAKKAVANGKEKSSGRIKVLTTLPSVDELRLAPGGIRAHRKNSFVIEFANGFTVRLFAGVPRAQMPKYRDLMVEWLTKRLSSN